MFSPFPSFVLVTIFKFNIPHFFIFSILHVKNIEYCCIFINFYKYKCIYLYTMHIFLLFWYETHFKFTIPVFIFIFYLFISFFLSICFLRTNVNNLTQATTTYCVFLLIGTGFPVPFFIQDHYLN